MKFRFLPPCDSAELVPVGCGSSVLSEEMSKKNAKCKRLNRGTLSPKLKA